MIEDDSIEMINTEKILFRKGKITPKKKGFFVTIWKRDDKGNTCPFASSDPYEYVIIDVQNGSREGKFIFPKDVLIMNQIFSHQEKAGKRGFRLYPPWENELNPQATKSQKWQVKYFTEEGKASL